MHSFFSGSVKALVSQLIESEDLSEEELVALRRELDQKLKE